MIQKRYEGFLKTPMLWKSNTIPELKPFEIVSKSCKVDLVLDEKLRLGKYVERFVSFEFKQHENISILAENIQIQNGKITLGELDCLLLKNNKPIHLEIIYKFYLYDDTLGKTEIEHFIGPNRKDSLTEKITKLKDKQLPLLNSNPCINYLKTLNLKPENIDQHVYFKAQLFVPFSKQNIQLKKLNTDCIIGFYINQNQLHLFKDCKFYFPQKKDWLIIPYANISWLNFNDFEAIAKNYFDEKFSALCWIKFSNGELKKVFLIWW